MSWRTQLIETSDVILHIAAVPKRLSWRDSIIPAYLLHAAGNLFQKLQTLGVFTNEIMLVIGVAVAGIAFIVVYNVVIDPFQLIWRDR